MDAAAARLTAAAAGFLTEAAKGSSSGGNTAVPCKTEDESMEELCYHFERAASYCGLLLRVFQHTSCALSPTAVFSLEAALPAAAAAVRVLLGVFRTYSKLPQALQQQPFSRGLREGLGAALKAMMMIAGGLTRNAEQGTLQSCPGADMLLLSPDLVSCLAVMVIASMLGLVTSTYDGAGAAAMPTASSSSRPVAACSTGLPPSTHEQQQQGRQGRWQRLQQ
jgi:hypothetical protein